MKNQIHSKKKNNFLMQIIFGIVVLIILISGYILYQPKKIAFSTPYYQKLAKECEQKTSKNCCLASVKRMEETKSLKISSEGVCNKGYKREMMTCIDSFVWCEKIITNNNDESVELPKNTITIKECDTAGGEV